MAPKRFAFVIADLYGGGAEKSLLYTADQLRQRGHEVIVFTLHECMDMAKARSKNMVSASLLSKIFP